MDPTSMILGAFGDEQPRSFQAGTEPIGVAPAATEMMDEMQRKGDMWKGAGMGGLMGALSGNPLMGALGGAAPHMKNEGMGNAVGELSQALMENDEGDEKRKALLKMGVTAMTGGAAAPFMGMF